MNSLHSEFRLASDPSTDLNDLERLENNKNKLIRGAVVLNSSTPISILSKLCPTPDIIYRTVLGSPMKLNTEIQVVYRELNT